MECIVKESMLYVPPLQVESELDFEAMAAAAAAECPIS
jgi:hypothetical protein